MPTFFLFLGFLVIVLCPMLSVLYAEAKLENADAKKVMFWLSFLPGVCLFMLYSFLKPEAPAEIPSTACGVVQAYQVHKTRGGSFERIHLRFDDTKYNRHLFFEPHLKRVPQGEKVCFEYIDKFKYQNLSESKLIKWIDPTEMYSIEHSNQIK